MCTDHREEAVMTGVDKNTEVVWAQIMEGLIRILDFILSTGRTSHGFLSAQP